MGNSVLVFISHSSEDKDDYIDPIVSDLEDCYLNIWIDRKKILPGDNLRKSILRDGLDKADVVLIFFTEKSLGSAWVDREIKHVLREEMQRGNDFDLSKIISIFDSESTYKEINKRYSELTDDLLHLMPIEYSKLQLGQLVSAIWSKYLDLQGGDIETQRQLLSKEKEIFQKEKEIEDLKQKLHNEKSKNPANQLHGEFEKYVKSEKLTGFLKQKDQLLTAMRSPSHSVSNLPELIAFGLVTHLGSDSVQITPKGQDFLKWYILEYPEKDPHTDNERDT